METELWLGLTTLQQEGSLLVSVFDTLLARGERHLRVVLWQAADAAEGLIQLRLAASQAMHARGLFRAGPEPVRCTFETAPLSQLSDRLAAAVPLPVLLPERIERYGDEMNCVFTPAFLTLLEQSDALAEQQDALLSPLLAVWDPAREWPVLQTLQAELCAFAQVLSESAVVTPEQLCQFRYFQHLQLWRSGLIEADPVLVASLCAAALRQPEHEGLQLALVLFKRRLPLARYTCLSPTLQAEIHFYFETCGRYLELLPAPESWTVTLVIVTYNRLESLKRSVDCALNQTYPDVRILIADGGSTDQTPQWARALEASNPRVRYLYQSFPRGMEGLRRTFLMVLEALETELVVFCPDDDVLMPTHLERTITLLRQRPWLAMVYTSYAMVDTQGVVRHQYGPFEYREPGPVVNRLELERAGSIGLCPQGCLHRADMLRRYLGPILQESRPEHFIKGWDYLLAVTLLSSHEVGFVPAVLFAITSAETTQLSGAHTDFTLDFLSVYEWLMQAYPGLVGQAYPREKQTALLTILLQRNSILPAFMRLFDQASSALELAELLACKLPLWQRFWRHYQDLKV